VQRQHIKGKIRKALQFGIRNRINSGETKRSIFDDLSSKYIEQEHLAMLIAGVPDPEDVPKIKKESSFIFYSLCAYAAIHTISILLFMVPTIRANSKLLFILPMTFLWPVVAIVCALQVKKYNGPWYRSAGWVGIILILNNLAGILNGKINDPFSLVASIVIILLLAASSSVALKIRRDFFPHFSFYGVKKDKGVYVLDRRQA